MPGLNEQRTAPVDTAAPLWNNLYLCKIPQLATTSELYIKTFGTPTTGDKEIDRALNNQLITTYKNIVDMVEYHRDGIPVYLCDPKDAKIIYDLVDNHLHAWQRALNVGLNITEAPIKDLIDMDAFAQTVFGVTKYETTTGEAGSPFIRYLNGFNMVSNVILKPANSIENKVNEQKDEPTLPERDSFASIFKSNVSTGKRW